MNNWVGEYPFRKEKNQEKKKEKKNHVYFMLSTMTYNTSYCSADIQSQK